MLGVLVLLHKKQAGIMVCALELKPNLIGDRGHLGVTRRKTCLPTFRLQRVRKFESPGVLSHIVPITYFAKC